MFRKNLRGVQADLLRNQQLGIDLNTAQQRRISDLRGAQGGGRELNQQEIDLLRLADQMELDQAQANRSLRDQQELNNYRRQEARGQSVSNPQRFEELVGAEKSRRKESKRQQTQQQIGRGLSLGGLGLGVGAGAVGTAVALGGGELFPFSLGIEDGDIGELAKKAALIERETEKRLFEDALAQETIASQTKLANDLYARQQKGALDTQMALAQQSAMTGQAPGSPSIDIAAKVDALAGEFVAQGVEPSVAINRAIDIVSMDGRANNYL